MVWAGISGIGKTALVQINGNLNSQRYINEIIVPHVQPFAQRVGQQFVFQQDNARAHTAHVVVNHFAQQGIPVMNWPAASTDMKPIEQLWDQLKKAAYRQVTDNTTLAQLSAIAQQEWQRIPMWWLNRLILSMMRRAAEC